MGFGVRNVTGFVVVVRRALWAVLKLQWFNPGGVQMRMNHSITIIVCTLVISASALVAFRYQIVVGSSLIYRLDRWSGDIRACIKQNPEDKHLLTCFHDGQPDTILADKAIPLPKPP